MDRYDIFFSGQLAKGADPAKVREDLRRRFKLGDEQLESMFSGTPVRIKSGARLDSAADIRAAMRDIGALVEIQPGTPDTRATREAASSVEPATGGIEDAPAWSVQPARGHDLSDCHREEPAVAIPDTSAMTLAQAGTVLDDHEPPSPPPVPTDHIELLPANSGSLEDCAVEKEPEPIPDISGISLEEKGG